MKAGRASGFHAGTSGNERGEVVTNGGRVFAITSFGRDIASARALSYAMADKIRYEGKYHRTDIGLELLWRALSVGCPRGVLRSHAPTKKATRRSRMAFSVYRKRRSQSICSGADLYLFWYHIQVKKAMKPMAIRNLLKKVPIGGTNVNTPVKKLPMKFQKAVQKATIVFVFTRQI